MAYQVGGFLSFWQQLNIEDRKKGLAVFSKQPKVQANSTMSKTRSPPTECPPTVFTGIQLSLCYNYLYYYPTMHWTLDRTPLDDTYWVGIFKKDAADDDYITYQWVKKTAQGSYKIGKLNTIKGMASQQRFDEFELRIFRRNQRLEAETNNLRGVINVIPTNPFATNVSNLLTDLESVKPDAETIDFMKAIESPAGDFQGRSSLEDLHRKWNYFAPYQQELLLPVLKQSVLPDEITKAGPKDLEWPEPKVRFPDIGKSPIKEGPKHLERPEPKVSFAAVGRSYKAIDHEAVSKHREWPESKAFFGDNGQSDKAANNPGLGPDKIVLTITLDAAYTYVRPQVHVQQEIPKSKAWMGIYYTQSDTCFDPDSYIANSWAWVGTDYAGKTTKLSYIEENAKGPTNAHYLGAIFDDNVQIGLAAFTIEASISATPALPPATFEQDFDKDQALCYAELSSLAYESYSEVKSQLPKFNLVAEMQIYDLSTDTHGFIASDNKSIVVAFRGTTSFTDWLTNLRLAKKYVDSNRECLAHGGFVKALNTVYDSIESHIKPYIGKKMIFITGHSLGGALATLTTYRLSRKYEIVKPTQFIYGCPPVGDIKMANYFKELNSNTITIQNDPVSTGKLISLGSWVGLYQPVKVNYLPEAASHSIAGYIKQLKEL